MLNSVLDSLYFGIIQPLFLVLQKILDIVFLKSLSFLSIPPSGQVVVVAVCTVLFSFLLRFVLQVEAQEKKFKKSFNAQKAERDNIAIIADSKSRDILYKSTDQSLDEDFNTYLAHHYFRYVLIYLLPLFLILAWLNGRLDGRTLPMVSGKPYLFLLPSHPFGMDGVSVTLLFLVSYIISLIVGFQVKKRLSPR